MSNNEYVSIDRIFAKLYRDLPLDNISEEDVIEWTGEALEFIGAVSLYEEAVAFIEVKNHQCEIPKGLHSIIQIAKNNDRNIRDDRFCPKEVIEELDPTVPEGPMIPVAIDCQGMPENAYDVAYYRPYFDFRYEYAGWSNSRHYQRYTPVRLSNNVFFNDLVCREQGVCYGSDEYTIIQKQYLRFSFKEGIVAVAYTRQMLDEETGYPMIPDQVSAITAITKYVTLRLMERLFYAGKEGSASKVQKAEADWHHYCGQARSYAMMPKGVDEYQNLLDQRSYMLPDHNKYYGFFGNLSAPEIRKFNDPDHRNNRLRLNYRR